MKGSAVWVAKHLCLHQGNGGDAAGASARGASRGHPPAEHHNQHPQGAIAWMDGRSQVMELKKINHLYSLFVRIMMTLTCIFLLLQDYRLGFLGLRQASLEILSSRPQYHNGRGEFASSH